MKRSVDGAVVVVTGGARGIGARTAEVFTEHGATVVIGDIDTPDSHLDVTDVEPMAHAVPLTNVLRADEVQPSIPQEAALANAPKQANGLFIVPKIVE